MESSSTSVGFVLMVGSTPIVHNAKVITDYTECVLLVLNHRWLPVDPSQINFGI